MSDAEQTPLDPARRKAAEQRVNAALSNAAYHERRAAQERTKAETLARVWGIPLDSDPSVE